MASRKQLLSRRLWLGGFIAALAGCARWDLQPPRPKGNLLPTPKMTRDTVSVEVAFVRQPASEIQRDEELWLHTDEQALSPVLRRHLSDNGLRAGKLGTQLPAPVRQLLDAGMQPIEQQDEADLPDNEFSYRYRNMQLRSGRRGKIIASKTYDSLALLTRDDEAVHGLSLQGAQCIMGVRVFPQGDTRARLELTPEIEYGEMNHQWVGEEGTLVQKLQKDHRTFDNLRIETMLSPGETFIFGGTGEIKGVGEHFFSETGGAGKQRRYLLIRLAQTQLDDLFDNRPLKQPLATPGD